MLGKDGQHSALEIFRGQFHGLGAQENAEQIACLLYTSCGFLSNPDEAYKLVDADYQKRVAFMIFDSLNEYLGG